MYYKILSISQNNEFIRFAPYDRELTVELTKYVLCIADIL